MRTIHAETNAIIQAALHGVSTRDSTCYVTHFPCINCSKALINAGIARLVYHAAYRIDENAMDFLRAAKIEIVQLNHDLLRLAGITGDHAQRPDEAASS
jgi:dCMP deaminase